MSWSLAALFALSLCGLHLFAARTARMGPFFTPLLTAAGTSLVLYAGGLAGLLEPAGLFVLASGVLCFARFASGLLRGWRRFTPPFVLCAAGAAAFCALALGLRLTHYDNFSHWALIVKELVVAGRFPRADTALLDFADYPPGTAVYLWFFCRFLGHAQGVMLLAQCWLVLCCFFAVFGAVREPRRFLPYSFLAAGCAMLSYLNLTIRINNLLVDFLLPMLALAAMAAARRFRDNPRRAAVFQVAVLGMAGIVKNTGPFFAAVSLAVFAGTCLRARRGSRGRFLLPLLTAAAALVPAFGWRIYLSTALAGYEGKFTGAAQGADAALYGRIVRRFAAALLDPSDRAVQAFFLCFALSLAVCVYVRAVRGRTLRLARALPLACASVLAYDAGLLFLCLTSMPEDEALRLAGFDRYACSVMVLFAGLLLLSAAEDIEDSFAVPIDERGAQRAFSSPAAKRRYQYAVLFTLVVAANFLYSEWNGLLAIRAAYPDTLAARAQRILGDAWPETGEPDERRYLVAASDRDGQVSSGEVRYVCRYFLYAPNVDVTARLDSVPDGYDVLVVLDAEAAPGAGVPGPGVYPLPHTS